MLAQIKRSIFLLFLAATGASWPMDSAWSEAFKSPVECTLDQIAPKFEPGYNTYEISGRCFYFVAGTILGPTDLDIVKPIAITVSWGDAKSTHNVRECFKLDNDNYHGCLFAYCPTDPVLFDDNCSNVSIEGSYGAVLSDTKTIPKRLLAREYITSGQRAALKSTLAAASHPTPTIGSPLNEYFYGDQFRSGPGAYRIPAHVTIPYRASLRFELKKIVSDGPGKGHMEDVAVNVIDARDLLKSPYGDGYIFAANKSYELPHGKYALYASAHRGNWKSDLSVVNFFVVDKEVMKGHVSEFAAEVAALPEATPDMPGHLVPEGGSLSAEAALAKLDRPDLKITTFAAESKIVEGQKRWHFVWTVRNIGEAIAPASQLRISCTNENGSPCALPGISGTYGIPQLWPKPDEVSGAHQIWNETAVAVPPGSRLNLKAEILADAADDPSNNVMLSQFRADDTPLIPPDQLPHTVAENDQVIPPQGIDLSYRAGQGVADQSPAITPMQSVPKPPDAQRVAKQSQGVNIIPTQTIPPDANIIPTQTVPIPPEVQRAIKQGRDVVQTPNIIPTEQGTPITDGGQVIDSAPPSVETNQLPADIGKLRGGYEAFTVISPQKNKRYALVPSLQVYSPQRHDILYSVQGCDRPGVNCSYYINPANNDIDWTIPAAQLQCTSGDTNCSLTRPFDMALQANRAYMLAVKPRPIEITATLVPFEIGSLAQVTKPELRQQSAATQASGMATTPPVFGAKSRQLATAPQAMPQVKPQLAQKPATAPALPQQPVSPMSKPLSGPAPAMQPPPMQRMPAPAVPMAQPRQPVSDPANEKAPVTDTYKPEIEQRAMLAKPVITYPAPNASFTSPARFTAKARFISGRKVFFGVRRDGQRRDVARSNNGSFSNLGPGNYCVYVTYDPGGPISDCVPFAVRLAVKRAPAQQTPAPAPKPAPVTPPMKQMKPVPVTPGG